MESYKIYFDRDVEKDLRSIPKEYVSRIIKKLLELSNNPNPPQSQKIEGEDFTYRLRVGDYRAIYQIDKRVKIITIFHIRHRKDIYRCLK